MTPTNQEDAKEDMQHAPMQEDGDDENERQARCDQEGGYVYDNESGSDSDSDSDHSRMLPNEDVDRSRRYKLDKEKREQQQRQEQARTQTQKQQQAMPQTEGSMRNLESTSFRNLMSHNDSAEVVSLEALEQIQASSQSSLFRAGRTKHPKHSSHPRIPRNFTTDSYSQNSISEIEDPEQPQSLSLATNSECESIDDIIQARKAQCGRVQVAVSVASNTPQPRPRTLIPLPACPPTTDSFKRKCSPVPSKRHRVRFHEEVQIYYVETTYPSPGSCSCCFGLIRLGSNGSSRPQQYAELGAIACLLLVIAVVIVIITRLANETSSSSDSTQIVTPSTPVSNG